jgi:DNA-binding transcriptional LysR family regulator
VARVPRLREVDLNLLPILRSLLETSSVARTAAALALTPSAVSHALSRLRDLFGDQLLVRSPRGLVATARAASLGEELSGGLSAIERVIGEPPFEPRTATRTFRFATSDFGARLALPGLLARLEAEAPNIQIIVRPMPLDTEAALASGELDAIVGVYPGAAQGLYRRVLFVENTSILVRRDHPRLSRGEITLEDYLDSRHILIAPRGRPGSRVDQILDTMGRSRHIAVIIPELMLGPYLVSETDYLLTAGERLFRTFAAALPVQVVATPFAVPPFEVALVWHARLHDEPAFTWFRSRLVDAHRVLRDTGTPTSAGHRDHGPRPNPVSSTRKRTSRAVKGRR